MRILRVIASMNPAHGGPGQGIRNSIPEMAKNDIFNEVVCLDDPASEFLSLDPFTIHALGPALTAWNYCRALIPWLTDNLGRFDAVIVHGLWLYHGYAVQKTLRLLAKRNKAIGNRHYQGPRLYIMPHGMLDPYFQQAEGRRFKALRNVIYWELIERKVINDATGLLFTCKAEMELARLPFKPYRPKREINVGYGVPDPPPATAAMRAAFNQHCPALDHHRYLLFLGRIHPKKGLDLLVQAYAELAAGMAFGSTSPGGANRGKQYSLPKLVIAGPGAEQAYGLRLRQLVSEHPRLQRAVMFAGMLTGDAKWGALYGCDAFVLPSHQENFGIAVVEALSCGKPVLISNQVNIWHEIESSGGGLVAGDTLDGTVQLLQKWLLLSASARSAMGRAASNTFKQQFSIGPVANRLYGVIAETP